MTYAYCPALDFNPLETQMTYEEILSILKDNTRTDYQRAADIHAALTKATQPSALNIKPQVQRKKRAQRAPEIKGGIPGDLLNGAALVSEQAQ